MTRKFLPAPDSPTPFYERVVTKTRRMDPVATEFSDSKGIVFDVFAHKRDGLVAISVGNGMYISLPPGIARLFAVALVRAADHVAKENS